MVHDELLVEFPENLKDTFPHILEDIMFNAAAFYCKKVPIPAEAEVGTYWKHQPMTEFVKNNKRLKSIDEYHKICYSCNRLQFCLSDKWCGKCYE